MATIKKNSARKFLESEATPFPSVSNWDDEGDLRFRMQIGFHDVSLTRYDRDMLIQKWAELEKKFEISP